MSSSIRDSIEMVSIIENTRENRFYRYVLRREDIEAVRLAKGMHVEEKKKK